jgi:hypothetical protein
MISVPNEAQQCFLDQVTVGRLSRRKFLSMAGGLAATSLSGSSSPEQALAAGA